jgi:hypothetical protein
MAIQSNFELSRLIYHTFWVDVYKFRANTYYSLLLKDTG